MSVLTVAERPPVLDVPEDLLRYPGFVITRNGSITMTRTHGDESAAPKANARIRSDPTLADLSVQVNFLDLNPEAAAEGEKGKRFLDVDANRIFGQLHLHPGKHETKKVETGIRAMRILQNRPGAQSYDVHQTSTETAFAVVQLEELHNPNIQRMLGCVGLEKVVAFPRAMLQEEGILQGQENLFPADKVTVEIPQSHPDAAGTVVDILKRAANLNPIVPAKRQVFCVNGKIPAKTFWWDAENFMSYKVDGRVLIPLFYAIGVKGAYSTDPSKDYWGYTAQEETTQIFC